MKKNTNKAEVLLALGALEVIVCTLVAENNNKGAETALEYVSYLQESVLADASVTQSSPISILGWLSSYVDAEMCNDTYDILTDSILPIIEEYLCVSSSCEFYALFAIGALKFLLNGVPGVFSNLHRIENAILSHCFSEEHIITAGKVAMEAYYFAEEHDPLTCTDDVQLLSKYLIKFLTTDIYKDISPDSQRTPQSPIETLHLPFANFMELYSYKDDIDNIGELAEMPYKDVSSAVTSVIPIVDSLDELGLKLK